jgi:hypothetical protein
MEATGEERRDLRWEAVIDIPRLLLQIPLCAVIPLGPVVVSGGHWISLILWTVYGVAACVVIWLTCRYQESCNGLYFVSTPIRALLLVAYQLLITIGIVYAYRTVG